MTFLLDTDTCVYFLRGHAQIGKQLELVGRAEIALSVVSLVELRYGAEYSVDAIKNHSTIDAFVNGIVVLGVDDRIAREFGQVKSNLRRNGQLIPDFDLLIASTALAFDLTLVTNNVAHFERIPNLQIVNWLNN